MLGRKSGRTHRWHRCGPGTGTPRRIEGSTPGGVTSLSVIDLKEVAKNPSPYLDSLRRRGSDIDLDAVLALRRRTNELQAQYDEMRSAKRNEQATPGDEAAIARARERRAEETAMAEELRSLQTQLQDAA